jgi:hypothetical protein
MPSRIQRSRAKGWRIGAAVYVGRTAGYSPWANPFYVGGWFMLGDPDGARAGIFRMAYCETAVAAEPGFTLIETRAQAVEWYRRYVAKWSQERIARCRRELHGLDLCCWCPLVDASGNPVPCHADVLLELANG